MAEHKDIVINFGKHVKKLRQQKELSTIQMSRRTTIDSGNYVKIEQGKTNPTLKTMLKICHALEINLSDLFQDFKH